MKMKRILFIACLSMFLGMPNIQAQIRKTSIEIARQTFHQNGLKGLKTIASVDQIANGDTLVTMVFKCMNYGSVSLCYNSLSQAIADFKSIYDEFPNFKVGDTFNLNDKENTNFSYGKVFLNNTMKIYNNLGTDYTWLLRGRAKDIYEWLDSIKNK